jgi:hypothetical protein
MGSPHGGIEQIGRRVDENGNICANFDEDEKGELLDMSTRVLTTLAIAWPQLVTGRSDGDEPLSLAISAKYNELYPRFLDADVAGENC